MRVLAVASEGGHWHQLMKLRPAFNGMEVHYATTLEGLPQRSDIASYTIIPDCNRNRPLQTIRSLASIVALLVRYRPSHVITTGALPGLLSLVISKLMGCTTIWVDSIANAAEISMSGRTAKRFSDLWVSQWEDVAKKEGAVFMGSVI